MNLEETKRNLFQEVNKLKTAMGYLKAGYPRYNTLFGRDSLISAWQMLKIDSSIAKATLEILARYQGEKINSLSEEEPGRILHEHRFRSSEKSELPEWKFPYYGSVDSTPLFLVLATEYFKEIGDDVLLSRIMGNILAVFEWMKNYGDVDGDGYVEYERKNPKGLFHQGWKDGVEDHLKIKPPVAIVEVQGYVYAAYQSLRFLMKELARDFSDEVVIRAKKLKEKFNKDFWMEDENFFALALDGEKRQKKTVTSNPGHLLFTGLVSQDKVKPLISRLFKTDLWTPYGIRAHSSMERDFDPYSHYLGCIWPHDNWIIYKGLQGLGLQLMQIRSRKLCLRHMKTLGKSRSFTRL